MPTKDDLTDQLTLTTKLTAQIERMAQATEKVEQSFTAQTDIMSKLAAALGQVDVQGTVQKIEVLNRSLKTMQDKMKDVGKSSEKTFQELGKKVEDTGKTFKDKFPKAALVTAGALSGLYQGIRNIVALGKGVTGFITGFVDGLVNIAGAIIAIPFKIFSGLVDLAVSSAGGMNQLMQAIENLRKEFGYLTGPTNAAIIKTSVSMKGFSDTGLSTWRVFGFLWDRLEALNKLAQAMGATFGKVRQEFIENGGAILAYQKGLGVADEDMKSIVMRSIVMGKKTSDSLKDMTKYSYELADAFGLDAKLISRDMSKALSDVKHFGGATVRQIAEASTYARKLGLELKDITGTLDAFDTFDTAAENVAKLSQAFGVQVDAFELMQAQSPAEQIDMLRKSFAKAGVDASTFNRQSLKLLSTTTGLDEAVVQSAFSLRNQGLSMEQVQKTGAMAEKKTLTQAEAMQKLAGAIERLVQSGSMTGGFFDQFIKGILGGIQSTKEFMGIMFNIRRAMWEVRMVGFQLGRALVQIVPGFKDILGGLSDFFKPGHFTHLFKGISDAVRRFFDPNSGDRNSIPRLVEHLQQIFEETFTSEGSAGKRILGGFEKLFKMMSSVAAQGIRYLSEKLAEGIKFVARLIAGKEKLPLGGIEAAGKGGLGFLGELIMPLADALKDAWKVLKPALGELLSTLANEALEWVKAHKSLFINVGEVILGYLFVESLVHVAAAMLAKVVIGGAVNLLGSAVGGTLKSIGGKVLAGMFKDAPVDEVSKTISGTLAQAVGKATTTGATAGTAAATGFWPTLLAFVTTVPTAAAAAGSAAIGASLSAIVAAGYAAWSANAAAGDVKDFSQTLSKIQIEAINASSKRVSLEAKKQSLANIDEYMQSMEHEAKDRKEKWSILGVSLYGLGKDFVEQAFGKTGTRTDDLLAKARREREDLQAQIKKMDEDASKKTGENAIENARKAGAALTDAQKFIGDVTVDTAKEKIESIEALSKKLMGKGFDIQKMVDTVKGKLAGVSFEILDPQQAGSLGAGSEQLKQLDVYFATMEDTFDRMKKMFTNVIAASKTIKTDAIAPALKAVSEMVEASNKLNDALSNGNVNKIDVKANLDRVARAVGLGGKATYTVNPSKQVQIVVNLEVTMDVDKVEKVMILRQQSIIRDRLDFATSNPEAKGNNVLNAYTVENPPPVPLVATAT